MIMLAVMPPESANSSPGYWYGSGLPNVMEALPQDDTNPRVMMRRASEAVIHSQSFHSHDSSPWDHTSEDSLNLDPSLGFRQPSAAAGPNHKAPLAPKQGLGSAAHARSQHQSPIAGTYALRTPRGKITSIACESCRKRKSKCDGVRPKCNTCQSKNLSCIYDVAEDGKTTTQLRAHVRRLAKELDDMKSILALLAEASDRTTATSWASELEKNGFAHHSVEEIKRSLRDGEHAHSMLCGSESTQTPISEAFPRSQHSLTTSSYDGSSGGDREQSQSALTFPADTMDATAPFSFGEQNGVASDVERFSFDCSYYKKIQRGNLANGWDHLQILGKEIDVDAILLGFMDPQDAHSVPTWSSRTCNKLLAATPLPVRLASTFLLTKMMRWLIWPTIENMREMPEWLMPLPRQELTPYDILVDLLPWPQLRQYLYEHPDEFVVGAFVGYIGIDWRYPDDACHYWDIEAGCTRLSPLFVNTINDLNNWTLDSKTLAILPQLESLVPHVVHSKI